MATLGATIAIFGVFALTVASVQVTAPPLIAISAICNVSASLMFVINVMTMSISEPIASVMLFVAVLETCPSITVIDFTNGNYMWVAALITFIGHLLAIITQGVLWMDTKN